MRQKQQNIRHRMNQFSEDIATSIEATTRIIQEIENGQLIIPSQQKPLLRGAQSVSSNELEENHRKLIENIRLSKQRTIREITDLEQKEKQFKEAIRNLKKSRSKKERSSFPEHEKNKIQDIIKQTKIKQEMKKKQHQQLLQSYIEDLKKEQEQEGELIERLREEHKRAVEHNLVSLEMRKKNREETKKQVSRRMLELKQKKYIHIAHLAHDQETKSKQQEARELRLEQIKQRFKLDFKEIIEHQQKCRQQAQLKSMERKERYKTENTHHITDRKYAKSIFYETLAEQERQIKLQEIRNANKAKQMREKIQEYKALVRENYMPKHGSSEKCQSSASPRKKQSRALSFKERIDQGNQYLKQAKKLRKLKDDPKLVTQPQIVKYADYLKTMGRKSKRSGTVHQFRQLVSKEDSIDYLSAEKAKYLVEEIEAKSKKTRDDRLIESIQNKIDLLKVLL